MKQFLQIVRWNNLVLTMVIGSIYGLISWHLGCLSIPQVITRIFLLATVMAWGNAHNDYCDQEIDLINRPKRPLSMGLSLAEAYKWILWIAAASLLPMLFDSWLIGGFSSLIVWWAGTMLLLYVYNKTLSGWMVVGNFAVALLAGAMPWLFIDFGKDMLIHEGSEKMFLLNVISSGLSFFITWAREAVKDLQDVEGDAAVNRGTLPVKLGIKAAKNYIYILYVVNILYIFWLYQSGSSRALLPLSLCFLPLIWLVSQNRFATASIWTKSLLSAAVLVTIILFLWF
jgi:geranylgeranylglycerol-phosphate geranylgeranyltransferase